MRLREVQERRLQESSLEDGRLLAFNRTRSLDRELEDSRLRAFNRTVVEIMKHYTDQLISGLETRRPRRILCTGHSLGGALATLGAAWCKTTLCKQDPFRDCPVQCITFGSPRVGNKEFARVWDFLLRSKEGIKNTQGQGKSYRIVNALDVVPSVPLSFQFQHIGMPVYLHREVENWDTKVWPCVGKERPKANTGSVIDHLQWHYTAAMVMAEDTVESVTQEERKSLPTAHSWWFVSFSRQLQPHFMWDVFKRTVMLKLPVHGHLWVLVVSWTASVSTFLVTQAVYRLALHVITLLLPAFTAIFLLDCFVAAAYCLYNSCVDMYKGDRGGDLKKRLGRLRSFKFVLPSTIYRLGNFSLAVVSLIVMVITYVSAWLGLYLDAVVMLFSTGYVHMYVQCTATTDQVR